MNGGSRLLLSRVAGAIFRLPLDTELSDSGMVRELPLTITHIDCRPAQKQFTYGPACWLKECWQRLLRTVRELRQVLLAACCSLLYRAAAALGGWTACIGTNPKLAADSS